jgi:biotin transport system permease protein
VIGLYRPGDSLLHRCPAGPKLLALAVGLTVLTVLASVRAVLVAFVLLVVGQVMAGVDSRATVAQVRPVLWVLVPLAAFQTWRAGWPTAVVVCGSILVAVLAAGLVTLTTRTEDLLDALVRALGPLRRFGVRPERVALLLALVIRTVPVLARIAAEVGEARIARGAQWSPRALAVPMVIRTVRHADRLGEALIARGADD